MDRFENRLNQAVWDENGKKIGRARVKILYFVSGRAGLEPKFQFLFRARPGSDWNFNFFFAPGRNFFSLLRAGWAEIAALRAEPEKSGPCKPLAHAYMYRTICKNHIFGLKTP